MANDLTVNPHVLDTVATIYDATKRVRISGVVYVGATAATEPLRIAVFGARKLAELEAEKLVN